MTPLIDDEGRLLFLLHKSEDVTAEALAPQRVPEMAVVGSLVITVNECSRKGLVAGRRVNPGSSPRTAMTIIF